VGALMAERTLKIVYAGDPRGVLGAIKQIDSAHASMGDKARAIGNQIAHTGKSMTVGLTLPLVGIGISAVKTAAEFETSMNTMKAVAGVAGSKLDSLKNLAIKMGAETVFSANEAAGAMLNLAKSGIGPAQIKAGALANTLDLATAGDLELADAATVASNAMNVFGLSGKKSQIAVDALAGAANASSADVHDLALALAAGGQAAANAGLTVAETTAVLGAFADAGIRGSDAGTSLKTFMLSLVPTSVKAAETIKDLGLEFVNSSGHIKNIKAVAAELQQGLGGLTQAEQQVALKTIFGTDAFRAASIIMKEGAGGLRQYEKSTEDVGTASDVATAKMKGLPGAIETLKGSIETAMLKIGTALGPIILSVSGFLTDLANKFSALSPEVQHIVVVVGIFVAALGPVLIILGKLISSIGVVMNVFRALSALFMTNPWLLLIAATVALVIIIIKNWDTIKRALSAAWEWIVDKAKFFWDNLAVFIIGPMKFAIDFVIEHWRGFKETFMTIFRTIKAIITPIIDTIVGVIQGIVDVIKDIIHYAAVAASALSKLNPFGAGGSQPAGSFKGQIVSPMQEWQHGGVVPVTGPAFLHAGETVIPAGRAVGNVYATINVSGAGDPDMVGRKVYEYILKLQRRNGTSGIV
jgi:TP901 family phage tail tape measure protein